MTFVYLPYYCNDNMGDFIIYDISSPMLLTQKQQKE